MKKYILACAVAAATCSSYAADTATLKVKGVLTNAACTPTLANGGVVDFGAIHLGELSATGTNQLGTKSITLNIICDSPTKVAWTTVDDRNDSVENLQIAAAYADGSDSSSVSSQFGLGKTGEGKNIGAYAVAVDIAGVSVGGTNKDTVIRNLSNGTEWSKSTDGAILNGTTGYARDITVADAGTTDPIAFSQAVFPLKVTAAIDSTDNLAITDDTNLDGQATISLVYL
ncbi:DUF1120 domain-containing protein [Scandinavium manionii]|uniref:DUF1120 domain-containing protein n=1 Tax=Scandinavium manionii TaxID=2926520 RepID=UPI0021666805|nr:DUF1120 domain-containing protein [Scandinavium manionii]MCS2167444.1 DUF1120 domain-containing protein [Scandinavium manionii]